MNVEITSRHARVGKQIKDHVNDRLEQVLRHADGITSVHCILDSEKGRHRAEFIVHGRGLDGAVHAESGDMWASIDAAAEKLRHQIEHRAGKKREKRRRGEKLSQVDAEMSARAIVPEPPEEPVRVVRGKARKLKSLALSEARTEMEDSDAEFLVFRDAKNDRVYVLFRRRDGQLGLVDTGVE
jgi:putative sigma-54 modulation protein